MTVVTNGEAHHMGPVIAERESGNIGVPGIPFFMPFTNPPTGTKMPTSEYPQNAKNVKLFEPLTIGNRTLKIGFVLARCASLVRQRELSDWHLVHLGGFAMRGVALVFTEATSVLPEGRISPEDAGIYSDEHIAPLKRVADFVHSQKGLFGVQITHAGRKASTMAPWCSRGIMNALGKRGYSVAGVADGGWPDKVVAPSDVPFDSQMCQPRAMTPEIMKHTLDAFVAAAERAKKAGVDVLEIHGAHGYLLHEWKSPISNKRTDSYGGSFENRVRYPLEVVRAVKAVWGDNPLFYRMSVSEYVEGPEKDSEGNWLQWGPEQSAKYAAILKDAGVHLVDCSSGGNYSPQKIPVGPLYQVPFSAGIKKVHPEVLTGAVGIIITPEQAEEVLQNNHADLIFMGRELMRNIEFPLKAGAALGVVVKPAIQYESAYARQLNAKGVKKA